MKCSCLVYGTMGDIGDVVKGNLESHGVDVVSVGFPQNILRDEFGYRRNLLKAIREYSPDIIIPVGNTLALAALKEELKCTFPGITVCAETPEKTATLDSKVRCYSLAQSLGIRQPRLYASPEDTPEGETVIFKRDISFGGHGVHMTKFRKSLYNLIDHQSPGEPYLIEEYIVGSDYSTDVFRCGDFFAAASYRSISERGKNGPSTERESVRDEALESIASTIVEHLDFNGVCGFDFVVTEDGTPYLMECNPRFTGGLQTQIASGLELPWMLYREASKVHSGISKCW